MITTADAGGVLEFVERRRQRLRLPARLARARSPPSIDCLYSDREAARAMGLAGQGRVREITWDRVIEKLTGFKG